MSSQEAHTEDKKKSSFRRRRPSGDGNRRRRGPREPRDAPAAEGDADKPRTPRPPSVPVPPEMIGKHCVGIITAIIRRGRVKFGFIHIGDEKTPTTEAPRIYFSFQYLKDTSLILRKGYNVQFTVKKDEKDRPHAADIELTEAGKIGAAEREASIAQKRSEREASGESAEHADRERRPRRPRKVLEEKNVVLKVTCDGVTGSKDITFDLNQSIGKLKNTASTAFEAPVTHNVYHVTKENPKGEFLTKAILSGLVAGDHVHLGEPREVKA